jgi:tripartite-type tricarboxylate transporter receptor subunit TctC
MKTIILILILSLTSVAHAFDARNNPVIVVVPYPPGNGTDLAFRHLQKYAIDKGVNLVPMYKPGADGLIGLSEFSNMPNNGLYLSFTNIGSFVYHQHKKPEETLINITGIRTNIISVVTYPENSVNNLDDLIQSIKTNKDLKIGYSVISQRMQWEELFDFVKQSKYPLMIPYKGTGQAMTDLIGKNIDFMFCPFTVVKTQIDSNKLKLIAVTKMKPDGYNASLLEKKFPGWVEFDGSMIVAPNKTNADAIEFWNNFLKTYLEDDQVRKDFIADNTIPFKFGSKHLSSMIHEIEIRTND